MAARDSLRGHMRPQSPTTGELVAQKRTTRLLRERGIALRLAGRCCLVQPALEIKFADEVEPAAHLTLKRRVTDLEMLGETRKLTIAQLAAPVARRLLF